MKEEHEQKRFSYEKLIVALGALFLINLFVSQRIFVTNIELTNTNREIAKLEESNKELEINVSRVESVDTIVKKAKLLGFDDEMRIIYLDTTSLAQK